MKRTLVIVAVCLILTACTSSQEAAELAYRPDQPAQETTVKQTSPRKDAKGITDLNAAESFEETAAVYNTVAGAECESPVSVGKGILMCEDNAIIGEIPAYVKGSGLSQKEIAKLIKQGSPDNEFLVGTNYFILVPPSVDPEALQAAIGGVYTE